MIGSNRIIALDIGASKVVLAEFAIHKGATPELLNYGIGRISADLQSETDTSAFVVSAIRDIMSEKSIKPGHLSMTISGQAVFPRFVKIPPVGKDKLSQIIRYEAEQNVPFPIDEVVWDHQMIDNPESVEQNVMLVAVKKENVISLTDCVQAVGLEPEIVDVAPMALYNTFKFNYPDADGCTMLLDIGARSSNLIFIEENKIFSRSIPVAGNAITQEIMKEFEVSFADAEELKIKHAFVAFGGVYAGPDSEVAERVSKVVRNVITRLHAEVNRSVNFYRSQQSGSAPVRILLTGGSSIISHTDTFFREKMKVEVDYLNPFNAIAVGSNINPEVLNSEYHLMGEVVGLALRKSLTCPIEINLMPPNLVAKKVFRKRQPFFAAAAVGLVFVMVCWLFYFNKMTAMIEAKVKTVQQKTELLQGISARLSKTVATVKSEQKMLDKVADVASARTQWIDVLNSIHSCMLEGMWITELKPVADNHGRINEIELSGAMFADVMKKSHSSDGTAIEALRNKLRKTDLFSDKTNIEKEFTDLGVDYVQQFSLKLYLETPIRVR